MALSLEKINKKTAQSPKEKTGHNTSAEKKRRSTKPWQTPKKVDPTPKAASFQKSSEPTPQPATKSHESFRAAKAQWRNKATVAYHWIQNWKKEPKVRIPLPRFFTQTDTTQPPPTETPESKTPKSMP